MALEPISLISACSTTATGATAGVGAGHQRRDRDPYTYDHDCWCRRSCWRLRESTHGADDEHWKIAIARDTAVPSLGLHGLHVACNGLPNIRGVGFFDSKADDLAAVIAVTGARRHYRDYVHMLDTEMRISSSLLAPFRTTIFHRLRGAERGIISTARKR